MKKEEFEKLIKETVKREADELFENSDEIDPEYNDQDNEDRVWVNCIETAKEMVYGDPQDYIDEDEYDKIEIENWETFEGILDSITWETYK